MRIPKTENQSTVSIRSSKNKQPHPVKFGVLLGTRSLLFEPPNIQIHPVSNSERMAAVNGGRDKKS